MLYNKMEMNPLYYIALEKFQIIINYIQTNITIQWIYPLIYSYIKRFILC
jgi:hypothetical protein